MNETTRTHTVERLSREPRLRSITVISKAQLTPNMCRIVFASPDLHDFECPGADDHFKLILPCAAATEGECRRSYTPRYFDAQTQTLAIDFAMHGAGPAMSWARAARPGDTITLLGPRKSIIVADDFDWYLLVGDMTALPAISRYLEILRKNVHVTSIVAIQEAADRQTVDTAASWDALWIECSDLAAMETRLRQAVDAYLPPPGDGYVWIATEGKVATALRNDLIDVRGHPASWLKASAYWHRTP